MKQMLRKKDVWVLLAALIGAFACVTLIQFISGRIDGVASMVFLLAVFFVSMYTDGYNKLAVPADRQALRFHTNQKRRSAAP